MSKVIAVFGAGTGLGMAVARRFGREGFRVALVARRNDRLDALVGQLAAEFVESAAFSADLSKPADEARAALPVVDPDDLAEHYWDMYTKRDRVEQIHPQPQAQRHTKLS